MAAPSMVVRSGEHLVVRSVVSGDALFGTEEGAGPLEDEEPLIAANEEEPPASPGQLPQCKIKRNYACSSCDYYTQNPRFFLYHQKQVHKEKIKIYECPRCLYASKHSQKLQRHIHMVHVMGAGKRRPPPRAPRASRPRPQVVRPPPPPPPPVQATPEEAEENNAPPQPIVGPDGHPVYKCSVCEMTSKSQTLVARHERIVHLKKKFYRCAKCNYVTHMKARYTKHVKYHSMPMIKCEMCDFRTPYKWNLDRHNKNHMGEGAFKCCLCNFRADIKQSLTVHEMNHHVPPVGMGPGGPYRRRYRVGASDTLGLVTEEDQIEQEELELLRLERESAASFPQPSGEELLDTHNVYADEMDDHSYSSPTSRSPTALAKDSTPDGKRAGDPRPEGRPEKKKKKRPIPNLIPIQAANPQSLLKPLSERKPHPSMSEKDLNDICAKSCPTSSLKDFASLIGDEDAFRTDEAPGITIPTEGSAAFPASESSPNSEDSKKTDSSRKKNGGSFFDELKEKLGNGEESDLTCSECGHESKCLSEHMKHRKSHSEESCGNGGPPSIGELSSTRCQYCRQRCKTSADLVLHLQSCPQKQTPQNEESMDTEDSTKKESADIIHPMENKVFVWNTLSGSGTREEEEEESARESLPSSPPPTPQIDDKAIFGIELKPGYGTATTSHPKHIEQDRIIMKELSSKKVYKCPHCNFWASTASRFHVHIVGHLNKRPFQCSLCFYSSNWRWDITKHIRLKSARDPAHSRAKVLLTDEAGRRNYTKYNKYLTVMHMEATPGGNTSKLRKILPKDQQQPSTGGGNLKRSNRDDDSSQPKKKVHTENRKTMWKCKRCLFRDSDRGVVLAHVKEHYRNDSSRKAFQKSNTDGLNGGTTDHNKSVSEPSSDNDDKDNEFPEHMCETCPYVATDKNDLSDHLEKHFVIHSTDFKCNICPYFGDDQQDLDQHMELHKNMEQTLNNRMEVKNIVYACLSCPYVATNRAQLAFHRKRHGATCDAEHKCFKCDYGAPSNLVLSLHMRLHARGSSKEPPEPHPDKRERIQADISGVDTSSFVQIPMAWVARNSGISKMFKCRYCPHVNMRKANITEHEKMHGGRAGGSHHRCTDCNYVCNNAGVLSSHAKVHQGYFGRVCAIADPMRSDEEQIREVERRLAEEGAGSPLPPTGSQGGMTPSPTHSRMGDGGTPDLGELEEQDREAGRGGAEEQEDTEGMGDDDDRSEEERVLQFCSVCPARFLFLKELVIHTRFHELKLPYKCDSCSYTARQEQHLWAHLKVHTDEYQERSNTLCEMYDISRDNPRPRVAVVLGEAEGAESVWIVVKTEEREEAPPIEEPVEAVQVKHFSCDRCPASFDKSVALNYHITLHGGPGHHKCRYCDYAVKTYGNLIKHEVIHERSMRKLKTKPKLVRALLGGRNESYNEALPRETQQSSIPVSGTELFQRKTERAKSTPPRPQPPPLQMDPEFGILIHGSPEFVYPTYMKNGKVKEKRYKCHKCPSAFEKREQYKIHLSLHGSKQRYNCERCDYSVKYYANYTQHLRKHETNDASKKEKKGEKIEESGDEGGEASEERELNLAPLVERCAKSMKMSVADHQASILMQQRLISTLTRADGEQVNRCPHCPYANNRKDGVGSHIKCHSGDKRAAHSCKYCDYSVPQLHYLRDHTKVHFSPIKFVKPEAYMKCDRLELWAEPLDPGTKSKSLVFRDRGETFRKERFLPEVRTPPQFATNGGGRVYINLKTGEEEVESEHEEEEEDKENSELNLPPNNASARTDPEDSSPETKAEEPQEQEPPLPPPVTNNNNAKSSSSSSSSSSTSSSSSSATSSSSSSSSTSPDSDTMDSCDSTTNSSQQPQ